MTDAANTVLAEQLDPGIADVVIMLRNLGFNPTDSGDGRSKPDEQRDFDVKHVACSLEPTRPLAAGEVITADRGLSDFFAEADRLKKVLGAGWRVEATYQPASGPDFPEPSYILLATKNDPSSPRHAAAVKGWPFELAGRLRTLDDMQVQHMYAAGCALHKALEHELGRR